MSDTLLDKVQIFLSLNSIFFEYLIHMYLSNKAIGAFGDALVGELIWGFDVGFFRGRLLWRSSFVKLQPMWLDILWWMFSFVDVFLSRLVSDVGYTSFVRAPRTAASIKFLASTRKFPVYNDFSVEKEAVNVWCSVKQGAKFYLSKLYIFWIFHS